jgi:hypothetical protein
MDLAWIIPLLALMTLLAGSVFALISQKRTEERRKDDSVPKSSLASDAPSDRTAP